jgi:hypothetical protein
MQILSHRGHWLAAEEKNSETAFHRSFAAGFGTETDIRDCAGKLVIAHDPPSGAEMTLASFIELHGAYQPLLPLALNVKADGLQAALRDQLKDLPAGGYFFFDMSVPDMLSYVRLAMPVFTRHSDVEMVPVLYEQAVGVWLDDFRGDWATLPVIAGHLAAGKQVCIVSPELHGRDHRPFWDRLAASAVIGDSRLMLCTDFPEEARKLFG